MIEPTKTPTVWPSALTRVAAQRDRARNVAIHLESEVAYLTDILDNLGWIDTREQP